MTVAESPTFRHFLEIKLLSSLGGGGRVDLNIGCWQLPMKGEKVVNDKEYRKST